MLTLVKKLIKQVQADDQVYFVGKSPVYSEYLSIGEQQSTVIMQTETYLQNLYDEMVQQSLIKNMSSRPICYFFDFNRDTNSIVVGRLGPNKDKSGRDYPCVVLRMVKSSHLLHYPLFIPSLFSEFYVQTDSCLTESQIRTKDIAFFKDQILTLTKCSNYSSKKHVLNSAMDFLFQTEVAYYINALKKADINLSQQEILQVWGDWYQKSIRLSTDPFRPLLIQLPVTKDLHHYVTFVCQLFAYVLDGMTHFRISWWIEQSQNKAYCCINTGGADIQQDLMFFNDKLLQGLECLAYNQRIDQSFQSGPSLFEVLQVLCKGH